MAVKKLALMDDTRGPKINCVYGFITNQKNKGVNNKTSEVV